MRCVYLIRSNDGRYKIGIAKNPKRRIKQLQTGNSDLLTLIESYETINARRIESSLHSKYSYARKEGEWFDLSINEEIEFISECNRLDNMFQVLKSSGNPFFNR
jgi:predicted GIY-YIG superfamily endonuclease